ncbi:MAG: hypothetical protein LAO79_01255 [Acidobacteriia bacterium]|nr:hypothetical protein [Terriglobia bacterium]
MSRIWRQEDAQFHAQSYLADDPWHSFALGRPEGDVRADYEYAPRATTEASLAFREFYAPRDAVHDSFLADPIPRGAMQRIGDCHAIAISIKRPYTGVDGIVFTLKLPVIRGLGPDLQAVHDDCRTGVLHAGSPGRADEAFELRSIRENRIDLAITIMVTGARENHSARRS